MAEGKQRSAIFKFFYVILRIITFPIFMVLFILRHPLWVLFLLLLLAGGAAYYPISQGVKADQVLSWYQDKYIAVKKAAVAKAEEKGMSHLVPQDIANEVKQIKEDEAEALLPKGENYNKKVVRDEKAEETKVMLKKRGGFKKQTEAKEENKEEVSTENDALSDEESATEISSEVNESKTEETNEVNESKTEETGEVNILEQNGEQIGGLAALIKKKNENISEEKENASTVSPSENEIKTEEEMENKIDEPTTNEEDTVSVEAKGEKLIEVNTDEPVVSEATTENTEETSLESAVNENEQEESAAKDEETKENDLELDIF